MALQSARDPVSAHTSWLQYRKCLWRRENEGILVSRWFYFWKKEQIERKWKFSILAPIFEKKNSNRFFSKNQLTNLIFKNSKLLIFQKIMKKFKIHVFFFFKSIKFLKIPKYWFFTNSKNNSILFFFQITNFFNILNYLLIFWKLMKNKMKFSFFFRSKTRTHHLWVTSSASSNTVQ